MLKKIKIKYFKNITEEEFDLTGNILISGENGSGKSSLLQALRYCLTDSLSEKLTDYIQWGQSQFELELHFDFENIDYIYFTSYKNTGGGKKLLTWKNNELKNSDASKKLKELLSSELLLYSSISEQGQSYSILLDSPTERLETFKHILGIDKIGEVIEKIKEDIKEFKINADLIKKEKETLEHNKFEFMLEFELPNINEIHQLLTEQEFEKEKKEKNEKLKQEYEVLLSEYQKKLTRKEELERLIESTKLKIDSVIKVEYNESEYIKLLEENWKQETNITNHKHLLKLYTDYEKQKQDLTDKLIKLKTDKNNISLVEVEELSFTEEDIKKLEIDCNEIYLELKETTNHLELIKQGKCPTCGNDFTNFDINDLMINEVNFKSIFSNYQNEIFEKRNKLTLNEKVKVENKISQSKLDFINKQILDLNYELNNLKEVNNPGFILTDITISDKLKQLKLNKSLNEEYEKTISNFNKSLIEYESELKNIVLLQEPIKPNLTRTSYDENEYKRLQKEINVYEQKVEELDRVKQHNKKIENDKKENEILIKQKEIIYYNIQEEVRILDNCKSLLDKQYSSYVIEKGTSFVEKQMNIFFQLCYPKYEVFFKQTDNKKSIDFYYTNNATDKLYSASLCSGFEKQLLSMAFRVALASITKVGFLILDEVDSDASENNSLNLYSNLIESKLFEQIICVTHKTETKNLLINEYNAKLIELISVKEEKSEKENLNDDNDLEWFDDNN